MREGPLWTPDPKTLAALPITAFAAEAERRCGRALADYDALHAWSVSDPGAFWDLVWDFCGVIGEKGARRLAAGDSMREARFFPDARLNFAENLLRQTGGGDGDRLSRRGQGRAAPQLGRAPRARLAPAAGDEGGRRHRRRPRRGDASEHAGDDRGHARGGLARRDLLLLLAGFRRARRARPLRPDRPKALLRLRRLLVQRQEGRGRRQAQGRSRRSFQAPGRRSSCPISAEPRRSRQRRRAASRSTHSSTPSRRRRSLRAAPLQPSALYPLLLRHDRRAEMHRARRRRHASSASEGAPAALLASTRREALLLHHLRLDDVELARVSGLATGATLLLYDGSPFYPSGNVLFDYAAAETMTIFGTSAKFIDAVKKAGLRPRDSHDLTSVRMLTSTGSPLAPENFDFVYEAIKPDIHLASISGGTDIVSCFVLGIPNKPVWRGEIQGPGLGMAVDVYDESGQAGARREGRARLHQAVRVDAGDVLERSRRRQIFRRLFRALPRHLGAWRLRRVDRARRHHHPRPLRRDAQPRRRPHRHGGNLRAGRGHAGGSRSARHRPGFRGRRARRAFRAARTKA